MVHVMASCGLLRRKHYPRGDKPEKNSINERCQLAADLVNNSNESWVVWCDLNAESEMLTEMIDKSVQVTGSDKDAHKENSMLSFANGEIKALVSKPKICGFGMNWQTCHNMIFVGLSDSFEAMYQAVRRCYRFGQKEVVNVHVVTHETEGAVVRNIERKEKQFEEMSGSMVDYMKDITKKEINSGTVYKDTYETGYESGDGWEIFNEDCVEAIRRIESDSIHYSLFSPPFASLFTYSNSDRDMGNCKTNDEFLENFNFLVTELLSCDYARSFTFFPCYEFTCYNLQ